MIGYIMYALIPPALYIPEKIKVLFIFNNISLINTNIIILIIRMFYNKSHIV